MRRHRCTAHTPCPAPQPLRHRLVERPAGLGLGPWQSVLGRTAVSLIFPAFSALPSGPRSQWPRVVQLLSSYTMTGILKFCPQIIRSLFYSKDSMLLHETNFKMNIWLSTFSKQYDSRISWIFYSNISLFWAIEIQNNNFLVNKFQWLKKNITNIS